jgi:hypothetical protein
MNEPDKHDEALGKLLQQWRADAPLPPGFQKAVWRRIEQSQISAAPAPWTVIARWIASALPRPALAVSYVAILLTLGLTAGWAQARQETARVKNAMGERYIRSLDPYQAPPPEMR